ncbi:MAG: type II toxin-antitoxin system Phd/YefM family antitoxin [Streptococcaceae bacterium]|jgi:PHD/YefM family antitoxin component YafN of YafNO toxin-antitoxin module|nr:type II toxin-antitoxin system Phd/YefM family antitoxin [Streptococcaceae bacterium]
METVTPTNARKNLYNIIRQVTSSSVPIEITSTKDKNESVVMIGKNDWNAIQETLYLQNAGVLDRIRQFNDDETEVLGDIDWDTL